jgi:cytochrome c-type biogenesis protein CcmH/NrfF
MKLQASVKRAPGAASVREPGRWFLRKWLTLLALAFVLIPHLASDAVGQSHVAKGGTVGIRNETEKELFFSLICMCGCPRETLGTCTCEYSGERRDELREMLEGGMSIQAVQKAYSAKFGTKSLALPPNEGLSRLIWALPLLGIVLGTALIVVVARRWVRQGAAAQKVKAPLEANAPRDDYDDKLDRELSDLDRE